MPLIAALLAGVAAAPARAAITWEGDAYHFGDLHAHTGVSGDGGSSDLPGTCRGDCGALDRVLETAAGAGLDFVAITDHVNGPASADEAAWAAGRAAWTAAPPPGLLVIPGAEVWLRLPDGAPLGHKNLLFFGDHDYADLPLDAVRPVPGGDIHVADCDAAWSFAAEVDAAWGPLLFLPHHPALTDPMPTDWGCHDPAWSPAVEVYSEHGNSDRPGTAYDPPWSEPDDDGTVAAALDRGLRLGFVGGTDRHDTRPGEVCRQDTEQPDLPYAGGLTVAVLPEGEPLTRAALLAAIVDRRTYATSGPAVAARWTAAAGAEVARGGEVLAVPAGQGLHVVVEVEPSAAPRVVEVILRGVPGDPVAAPDGNAWRLELPAEQVPPWLYPEIVLAADPASAPCEDGGADDTERIWLAPLFVEAAPPPDTGSEAGTGASLATGSDTGAGPGQDPAPCGCAQPGTQPLAPAALALLAAAGGRFRRRAAGGA